MGAAAHAAALCAARRGVQMGQRPVSVLPAHRRAAGHVRQGVSRTHITPLSRLRLYTSGPEKKDFKRAVPWVSRNGARSSWELALQKMFCQEAVCVAALYRLGRALRHGVF